MANKPYIYCPYCKEKLESTVTDGRKRERCPVCATVFYTNPLPVFSALLVDANRKVLLVLRKNEPHKDMWCLPIGFAETDKDIQGSALRELEKETGAKGRIVRLLDAQTINDSFYGSMLILCYEVERVGGEIKARDDAKDARFFPIKNLSLLAFKPNEKAIAKYQKLHSDLR